MSLNNHQLKERLNQAKQLHNQGVDGDKEAVKEAFEMLKELHQQAPNNNLIKAYYGSTITLLGRDAKNNKERIKIANQGLNILDNAVHKEPDHIEIRLLRAYVSYRIPEKYFKRTESATKSTLK